jgi:ABC-type nitrate/sulfonate/bicarbonate transport system substrate-binding protein
MLKLGPGGKLLLILVGVSILAYTGDRYALEGRAFEQLRLFRRPPLQLTSGDFPPGAAAPVGDLVSMPLRPLRLLAVPRGSAAALLLAAGGPGLHKEAPAVRAYGIDLDLALVPDERALAQSLALGGDRGGADAGVVTVDRLAQLRATARDAKLKAVLLLSRSRGQEAVAGAAGVDQIGALQARRVAVPASSPARLFLYWSLSQALLSPSALTLVPVGTSAEAARLLREGRVDAAAGSLADLSVAAKERGGRVIATTADAPHLVQSVLAVRSDVTARYPDAVRRLVRALLDAQESAVRDPTEAARALGASAPQLGDPFDALKADPPATLFDNLAFFGIRGDCPVRYEELYASAASLSQKLGEPADQGLAADSRELGPLLSASVAVGRARISESGAP